MPTAAYADFVIPLFEPVIGVPLFLFVAFIEAFIFAFLCISIVKINVSFFDCCLIVLVANVASFACGVVIDEKFFRLTICNKVITDGLVKSRIFAFSGFPPARE